MPNFDDDLSFSEYDVPLENSVENSRRSRTFSSGGDSGRSDRSLAYSDIVRESDESPVHYADGRFSSRINQKPNDDSLRAPRRRISSQTVSFREPNSNDEEVLGKSSRNNSPSRLGMDGIIVQDTIAQSESDIMHFNPQASQNFSVASSDATFRKKPPSHYGKGMPGLYDGFKIQEEKRNSGASFDKRNSGASFDESELSFNSVPGLKRRVQDIFNFRTISILIVKLIPYICCVWCFRSRNEFRGSSYPDRFILSRLNILSFFFSAIQLAASVWLLFVMFIEGLIRNRVEDYQDQFNLWNNNAIAVLIGLFAMTLLGTCFWTIRIAKDVDLVGALRYLWLLLWILPIVAFLNITAFDFYDVTSIWIRHNWDSTQLWWFRNQFCSLDTDESLCLVPIEGGMDYDSEDEWCFEEYNSTGCTEIRNEAQETTTFFLLTFYRALASWGFAYMFIMLLMIKSLERIISKPMVQKSREVNVVGWLTFPVFCTALFGSVILFSPYTYIDKLVQPRWVGYLYLITSGLFFLALLMGWCLSAFSIQSNVDKQNKSNAALILVVVLFMNALVLLGIVMASFFWSRDLNLSEDQRGAIACTMNDAQCTDCDSPFPELVCPEWSIEEITSIVRRQLNQSAFMAAIFILYDLNVMVHGFNLRKHLSMYQIDYV